MGLFDMGTLFDMGKSSEPIKPLQEGATVTVANNQAAGEASWFDTLNDLGDKAGGYLNDIFGAYVDKKADEIRGNPDAAMRSTGNVNDQPGGGVQEAPKPFYVTYQKELMYGGAAVAGLILLTVILKR